MKTVGPRPSRRRMPVRSRSQTNLIGAECLLPRPRRVRYTPGSCSLRAPLHIRHQPSPRGDAWFRLRVGPSRIDFTYSDYEGFYYGIYALLRLREHGRRLRCMDIEDWPDFPVRGVMLDISRCKVPTMPSLLALVDSLARLRINQLQLYTEHTFAYRGHERVWRGASPMTPRQIRQLDKYCAVRGVELVPNQNSFGHMERWLRHAPYRRLAETTGPWKTPWGTTRTEPTTLCPLDPGSLKLVAGVYDQLLPNFSSIHLNVGCDEPFELGQGRSAGACRRRGVGRVYLDYLLKLHREVNRRGGRMMFWSDIVHQHPSLIRRLPRDVIPLVWGYESDHPYDRQCRVLRRAKLMFYVCPGTSSWCSLSGRTTNAVKNLLNAARAGRKHGAAGYLITDWGDYGHRQYSPASYAGFVYGASISWCAASNGRIDVGREISRHFFGDEDHPLGPLWAEAGRVHEESGISLKNRTILFSLMETPMKEIPGQRGLTRRGLAAMKRAITRIQHGVEKARHFRSRSPVALPPFRRETARALRELTATLEVLHHACRRGELAYLRPGVARRRRARSLAAEIRRIMSAHRRLWLTRNRPGGLRESLAYYQKCLAEYQREMSER